MADFIENKRSFLGCHREENRVKLWSNDCTLHIFIKMGLVTL